jgi:hypothetical protein
MSTIVIIMGFFSVKNGTPEHLKSRQIIYESAFLSTDDDAFSATIRYYDVNGLILPDKSLVYIMGKLFISGETPYIEPIEFTPFPGDPTDDDYANSLPSPEPPFILSIGSVCSKLEQIGDGEERNLQEFGVDSISYCVKTSSNQLIHTRLEKFILHNNKKNLSEKYSVQMGF